MPVFTTWQSLFQANNCYLMSRRNLSVKVTKSIFTSTMDEVMRTHPLGSLGFLITLHSGYPTRPRASTKCCLTLQPQRRCCQDGQAGESQAQLWHDGAPKILMSKPMLRGGSGCRISLSDMPRSPWVQTLRADGSNVEQDTEKKATSSHSLAPVKSMDFLDKSTASSASTKTGQAGSLSAAPNLSLPRHRCSHHKNGQDIHHGSILNLNLHRSKADGPEGAEWVCPAAVCLVPLISPSDRFTADSSQISTRR